MFVLKFQSTIDKQKKKISFKRQVEKIIQSIIRIIIGYPYIAIEKLMASIREKHWIKNKGKYEKKVLQEMINYIQRSMTRESCNSFVVYNDDRYDENNYSNAIYMDEHLGWSSSKKNKLGYMYFKTFNRTDKDIRNKFYRMLEDHFKQYEDVTFKYSHEEKYKSRWEYFTIIFN